MEPEGVWSGRRWRLRISAGGLDGTVDGTRTEVVADELPAVQVRRRWFRWELAHNGAQIMRLRGASRLIASEIDRAVRRSVVRPRVHAAVTWYGDMEKLLAKGARERRWVPREAVERLRAARPAPGLVEQLVNAGLYNDLTASERDAVQSLDLDLVDEAAETNDQIMQAELRERAGFFSTIERSPLTEEQARAVVCFDNRVQVLAAAGSGKTSIMVARAAYAVCRGFVQPERILLLAFNRAAAEELQSRIRERLTAAGIDPTGVRASTFHAFGLSVIGRATGTKPRLARWLDGGQDVAKVLEIVDNLRDHDPGFRRNWDLYRTLYGRAPNDIESGTPDARDKQQKRPAYRTFNGELVKSAGERLIANWLYLNGIIYEYERDYVVNLASSDRSQYRPDFYYPAIEVWHEHWALDRDGNPPEQFRGYRDGMDWKLQQHATHGTTLVESTWAQVMYGDGLDQLETELTDLGLSFDWNPDRPVHDKWATPIKHEDLARLVRTFMTHVKAGGVTRDQLITRLESGRDDLAGQRTRVFLDLYWAIHDEWERQLAADGSIDFEDMLARAADHLETGDVDTGHELILVDEFQDANRARARLVAELVNKPDRYLLAVGDDWQSINRFAGADLSVMTSFTDWFGHGPQLALTTTFRCTQTICDVARNFVSKNPTQFDKPMRSAHEEDGPAVMVIAEPDPAQALQCYLQELSRQVETGMVPTGADGTVTVDVLGRYRFDRDVMPETTPAYLKVGFRTVHGAKGLEADIIVLPKMVTGTYGFPSAIVDDPVLSLAMPAPDTYPDAEERRLFYVALTRARRQVVAITTQDRMSRFVAELIIDGTDSGQTTTRGIDAATVKPCPSPKCGGHMARHSGRYGPFLGCSNWPACDNKMDMKTSGSGKVERTRPKGRACPGPDCDGHLVPRTGKHGPFLGCTNYPDCKKTRNIP